MYPIGRNPYPTTTTIIDTDGYHYCQPCLEAVNNVIFQLRSDTFISDIAETSEKELHEMLRNSSPEDLSSSDVPEDSPIHFQERVLNSPNILKDFHSTLQELFHNNFNIPKNVERELHEMFHISATRFDAQNFCMQLRSSTPDPLLSDLLLIDALRIKHLPERIIQQCLNLAKPLPDQKAIDALFHELPEVEDLDLDGMSTLETVRPSSVPKKRIKPAKAPEETPRRIALPIPKAPRVFGHKRKSPPEKLISPSPIKAPKVEITNEIWYENPKELQEIIQNCCTTYPESVTRQIKHLVSSTGNNFWYSVKTNAKEELVSVKVSITSTEYFSLAFDEDSFQKSKNHFAIELFEAVGEKLPGEKDHPLLSIRVCEFHGEIVSIKKGSELCGNEVIDLCRIFLPLFSKIPVFIFDAATTDDGFHLSAFYRLRNGVSFYEKKFECIVYDASILKPLHMAVKPEQSRVEYKQAMQRLTRTKIADVFSYCLQLKQASEIKKAHGWKAAGNMLIEKTNALFYKESPINIPAHFTPISTFSSSLHENVFPSCSDITMAEFSKVIMDLTRVTTSPAFSRSHQEIITLSQKVLKAFYNSVLLLKPDELLQEVQDPSALRFWQDINQVGYTQIFVIPPKASKSFP